VPVTVDRPFEPRTTLAVDRANRLHSLIAHPGWNDMVALSEQTVKIAEDALVNFEGWDRDELVARSIAFRAAKKSHQRLFNGIQQAVQAGVEEAAVLMDSEDPFSRATADMADDLRVRILQHEEQTRNEGAAVCQ